MNLIDYARIITRRGWILVLLAVVAAAAAFLFSQQMTPLYRSTQQVLIVPSRSDFGLTEATTRLLNSHVAYLNSNLVADQIIDGLSLDMTPGFLRSRTTIAANRDSLLIQIDVDLEDGELANRVSRAWGEQLVIYRNDLNQEARREDRITAQLQDDSRFSLLRPNVRVNTIVGAVLGFFLGGIIIFVLEYLESSIIRRREDVERSAQMAVLAAVPAE